MYRSYCFCLNLPRFCLSRSVLNLRCWGGMSLLSSSEGVFSLILDRVRGSLHVFPGEGVGLGFFYAYRRSNTRIRHSMRSADFRVTPTEIIEQSMRSADWHAQCFERQVTHFWFVWAKPIQKTGSPPPDRPGVPSPPGPPLGGERVDFAMVL